MRGFVVRLQLRRGLRASPLEFKIIINQIRYLLTKGAGALCRQGAFLTLGAFIDHELDFLVTDHKRSQTSNPESSYIWGRQCLYISFAFLVRLGCRSHFQYFFNNDH